MRTNFRTSAEDAPQDQTRQRLHDHRLQEGDDKPFERPSYPGRSIDPANWTLQRQVTNTGVEVWDSLHSDDPNYSPPHSSDIDTDSSPQGGGSDRESDNGGDSDWAADIDWDAVSYTDDDGSGSNDGSNHGNNEEANNEDEVVAELNRTVTLSSDEDDQDNDCNDVYLVSIKRARKQKRSASLVSTASTAHCMFTGGKRFYQFLKLWEKKPPRRILYMK
jgi:hypothetical protein